MSDTTLDAANSGDHTSDIRKIVFASLIGSTIEWYDFFLYGVIAGIVFNHLYFPSDNETVSIMLAYATFAVGFVARPLGGLVFGHFGDRIGRKAMLIVSLLMMGGATVVIGLLPSYQSIGIPAPILLLLLRIFQGIGIGGEWGGAVLMTYEYAPMHKRGFYASLPQIGLSLGLFLSSGVMALLSFLPDAQFMAWGWRAAFIGSIVLVALGAWMRSNIQESPEFKKAQLASRGRDQRLPLRFVPPMGNSVAFIVIAVLGLVPCFERKGIPAIVLEQHHRPPVGGVGGQILLQPRQAAGGAVTGIAGKAMRLHKMQPAPVPGIAIGIDVIAVGRHRRLEEHAGAVIDLDVVAQFPPIPVDVTRRPVLVEIVVAQPRIDRKVDAVRPNALLVALGKLQQLRAFARQRHLAAAVVGHVAADNNAERGPDLLPGKTQPGRRAADLGRPDLIIDAVQGRDVAQQVGVGLAFLPAAGAQALRHAAGMDIGDEQEGGVDGRGRGMCRPVRRESHASHGSRGNLP